MSARINTVGHRYGALVVLREQYKQEERQSRCYCLSMRLWKIVLDIEGQLKKWSLERLRVRAREGVGPWTHATRGMEPGVP